jgi:hypothetical protein
MQAKRTPRNPSRDLLESTTAKELRAEWSPAHGLRRSDRGTPQNAGSAVAWWLLLVPSGAHPRATEAGATTMQLRLLVQLPLLAALSACAGHDSLMSDHADLFDEHSSAYETELNDHDRRITDASDVAAIATLEQEHAERSAGHMAGMQHEMADMMSCASSDGSWTHAAAATANVETMDKECMRHQAAMAASEGMEAAREEESNHQHTMRGMMESMRSHTATLMSGTMSMACSHHED